MNLALFFLDSGHKVRKVCKELDFSQKLYFVVYLFKVSAWISSHTVCKIGFNSRPKRKYYNRPGDDPNEGGDAILPRVGWSAAVSVAGVRAGDVVVQRVGPRSVQP